MTVDADTIEAMHEALENELNLNPPTRHVRGGDYTIAVECRPRLGLMEASEPTPKVVLIRYRRDTEVLPFTADNAWLKQAVSFIERLAT